MKMMFTATLLIALSIILVSWAMMKKFKFSRETSSPFECGFDPNNTLRAPLSVRFFFIMLMFLIFDIEIVLLLPIPLSYSSVEQSWIVVTIFFILILIFGLLMEWKMGTINWA